MSVALDSRLKLRPILKDNYMYLILARDGQSYWCVDPGDPLAAQELIRSKLRCNGIFLTHHHSDHTQGVPALASAWSCPVYGPSDPRLGALLNQRLTDGDTVTLDEDLRLRALETPGHTVPALSYVLQGFSRPYLFSGDTLFGAGCGRLFEGQPEELWESLKKLRALSPTTALLCGHEYTEANLNFVQSLNWRRDEVQMELRRVHELRKQGHSSLPRLLEQELRHNPFLNADDPELARALELAPSCPAAQVFAQCRRLRDAF